MSTLNCTTLRGGLTILAALSATGCPFKDDYYIESNDGSIPTGGASAAQAGGSGSLGGQGSSGGTAGTSTTGMCTAGNCAGTCCNGACVDLATDPSNCGACSTTCLGGQNCVLRVCTGGWSTMAPAPATFIAREKPAYVAMGDRLFIFGGADLNNTSLNDGAIYDALTNRWTLIAVDANTPSPRRHATALWTGSVVLVYGGRADMTSVGYMDAAAYDPNANRWIAIPTDSNGRVASIGITNSAYSLYWGGWGLNSVTLSGAERYNWASNIWEPATAATGADPGALDTPAWAFTGQYLYAFGGRVNATTKTNQGYIYDLTTNAWANLTTSTPTLAPSARWGAFGAWDGAAFYVWAGRDEYLARNDGASVVGGVWKTMTAIGAPTTRWVPIRQTGWAFARAPGDVVFFGGQDFAGNCRTDGGRYTASSGVTAGSWTAIPSWKSGEDHQWAAAAYVGGAVVVWGGRNGTVLTTTGDRWAP